MIAADISIQDIDAEGWANLLSLGDNNRVRELAGEIRRSSHDENRLLIVYEYDIVMKAWHSGKGSILDGFTWHGPDDLESLARREGVSRVVALEKSCLDRIFRNFQSRMDMRDDYVKQILSIYGAVRAEVGRGLHFYPKQKLINLDYEYVNKLFRLAIRDECTILFYLFDDDKVWTSLIIGVGNGDVNLVTSHDAFVAKGMGVYNWRKDYKKILDAAEKAFARPSLGFFADLQAFARMARSRKTLKTLAEERKRRNIILEPLPLLLKTTLGAGKFFI